MKTYVRREKKDKRVIEIDHFTPPNFNLSDHQRESAASKEKLPNLTKSSPDENKDTEEDILDLPLAQWIQSRYKSNVDEQRTGTSALEVIPEMPTNTRSCDICRTPGSVVWAKKSPQIWWPAEVLIRELPAHNSDTEVTEGLVFVQYDGSEGGLADPARDLSPFEDCFKERSCNSSEEFQEALKQAVHKKKQLSLTKQSITSSEGHACYGMHVEW